VEVLDDTTLLMRLEPDEQQQAEADEDSLMLGLFLDFRRRAARGMSPLLVRHGWTIAFQPQLFARHVAELKAEVKRLKQELDPQAFVQHPHGACC
jgi:hypothetical protein